MSATTTASGEEETNSTTNNKNLLEEVITINNSQKEECISEEKAEESDEMKKDSDIREWFGALSIQQRMAALSLEDPMLIQFVIETMGSVQNENEEISGWGQTVSLPMLQQPTTTTEVLEEETETTILDETIEKEEVNQGSENTDNKNNIPAPVPDKVDTEDDERIQLVVQHLISNMVVSFPCVTEGSLYCTLDATKDESILSIEKLDGSFMKCFQRQFLDESELLIDQQTSAPLYTVLVDHMEKAVRAVYQKQPQVDVSKLESLLSKREQLSEKYSLPADLLLDEEKETSSRFLVMMPLSYISHVVAKNKSLNLDEINSQIESATKELASPSDKNEELLPEEAAWIEDTSNTNNSSNNNGVASPNKNNPNGAAKKKRKKKNRKKNKNKGTSDIGQHTPETTTTSAPTTTTTVSPTTTATSAPPSEIPEADITAPDAVAVAVTAVETPEESPVKKDETAAVSSAADDGKEEVTPKEENLSEDVVAKEDDIIEQPTIIEKVSSDVVKEEENDGEEEDDESRVTQSPPQENRKQAASEDARENKIPSPDPESQNNQQPHDDTEWETVSTKSRGRKGHKLPSSADSNSRLGPNSPSANSNKNHGHSKDHRRASNHHSHHQHHHHHNNYHHHHHHHNSHHQHQHHRRKNNSTKKMARDILSSVLDSVATEVQNNLSTAMPSSAPPSPVPSSPVPARVTQPAWSGADQSYASPQRKTLPAQQVHSKSRASGGESGTGSSTTMNNQSKETKRKNTSNPLVVSPSKSDAALSKERKDDSPKAATTASKSSGLVTPSADQSTAPTYQETVSALSSTSNTLEQSGTSNAAKKQANSIEISPDLLPQQVPAPKTVGTSAAETDFATHPTDRLPGNETASLGNQMRAHAPPPLPTLLSPENANSTASSVASSLEAPRSHHHHHHPPPDEQNAVGCHLLDVCDRLSNDMGLFMKSRSQAVGVRRNERTILLGALQEVISGIWPNSGRVEMYGSCASLLDLPSSDLDVVVVGLDDQPAGSFAWNTNAEFTPASASQSTSDTKEESKNYPSPAPPQPAPSSNSVPPPFIPIYSMNAHRVIRLSSEIEQLPWAVKVKSIPSATVPVIKILADPSKIPGFGDKSDWHGYTLSPEPWRGADVMDGLISLDITFQGPEHGGIGSTEYSMHVVNQMCQDSGVMNPDETPFVQCLMVLKELLAQRKLNEPYSGGLSSYALLLLLTALLRERAAIREEIERVEQHRQTATVTPVNSSSPNTPQAPVPEIPAPTLKQRRNTKQQKESKNTKTSVSQKAPTENKKAEEGRRTPVAQGTSTSWASVAKKTDSSIVSSDGKVPERTEAKKVTPPPPSQKKGEQKQEAPRKPLSFADAVGKSAKAKRVAAKEPVPPNNAKSSSSQSQPKTENNGQQPKQKQSANVSSHSKNGAKNIDAKSTGAHSNGANMSAQKDKKEAKRQATPAQQQETQSKQQTEQTQYQQQLYDPSQSQTQSFFPQGFTDVIEVLCLGEMTSGKLLMHFLLHYGQYFDSTSTAIDISGTHERIFNTPPTPYLYLTPFIQRSAQESIDPHTGMLVVDHIVIYDPLEGAEKHNVARRCFAWHQVRWIFAQSYATLASAVERSPTSTSPTSGHSHTIASTNTSSSQTTRTTEKLELNNNDSAQMEIPGDLFDPSSSPLLRCLLSF